MNPSHAFSGKVEFGLVKENEGLKIYGSGIISSIGESKFALSGHAGLEPFDIEKIIATERFAGRPAGIGKIVFTALMNVKYILVYLWWQFVYYFESMAKRLNNLKKSIFSILF